MDFIVRGENCTVGVRAVKVLIKDNKILVQREEDENEYALLGGNIKLEAKATIAILVKKLVITDKHIIIHYNKRFYNRNVYLK